MKIRLATLLTIVLLASAANAQYFCGTHPGRPAVQPIQPQPVQPQPSSYFLGVSVSTVEVEAYGRARPANSGMRAMVVGGAGQAVYGQRINQVSPNSPAAQAGLEPGDILLDANGYPLDTPNDLQTAINTSQGRLEMKVIDSRTGRMMWLTARTDAQSSPMMAVANRPSSNRVNPALNRNLQTVSPVKNLPQTFPQTQRQTQRQTQPLTRDVQVVRQPIFRGGR